MPLKDRAKFKPPLRVETFDNALPSQFRHLGREGAIKIDAREVQTHGLSVN